MSGVGPCRRLKLEIKDIAYDKYDEHGFVGRFIDQNLKEKKDQSRLLYTFSKTVPGGGAGGGTPAAEAADEGGDHAWSR